MANKLAVAGPGSQFNEPDAAPAGFWAGLWHGMILPITFFVSLFKPEVGIYETHNNGGWYNFGFFLGVASAFGKGAGVQVKVGNEEEEQIEEEEKG
jgi:hypothetical protein